MRSIYRRASSGSGSALITSIILADGEHVTSPSPPVTDRGIFPMSGSAGTSRGSQTVRISPIEVTS